MHASAWLYKSLALSFHSVGDSTSGLTVGALSSELITVSADWRTLGLKLGVEEWQLKVVERDHCSCKDKLVAALDKWLKMKTDTSWVDITDALKAMGEFALAMRVKDKYIGPATSKFTVLSAGNRLRFVAERKPRLCVMIPAICYAALQ